MATPAGDSPASAAARHPTSQKTVSTRPPSRTKVLTRWIGTETARATEASSATHSARTITAPISASMTIEIPDTTAPTRAGWPRSTRRKTIHTRAATTSSATPLAARWVNSIAVAPSSSGTSTPLHDGHERPHPAPDPVARTKAPSRMTTTFTTRATTARSRRRFMRRGYRFAAPGARDHSRLPEPVLSVRASWAKSLPLPTQGRDRTSARRALESPSRRSR